MGIAQSLGNVSITRMDEKPKARIRGEAVMIDVIIYVLACIGAMALLVAAIIAIALVKSGHTPRGET